MNKFSTPSDEDYETVADEVARMVGAAPQLISARQHDEHGWKPFYQQQNICTEI